jgi:4a-hydroxytetrahydrobiopterin dehydratase
MTFLEAGTLRFGLAAKGRNSMDLANKHCVPCDGSVPRLSPEEAATFLEETPRWTLGDERLERSFEFRDFAEAIRFVNAMADVAEAEGHHPDFSVHWNRVDVSIWTHAVGGLTENDFILAARIDGIRTP